MSITPFFPTGHDVDSISYFDSTQSCRQLTFSEIQLATKNFDESLVVGRGGFGKVYKGTICNGVNILTVAIKRLDSTSNQGALEFWAEVKMLSRLRHSHLVSLIGYCNEHREMILVYDYMPHGSLEDHLHKRLSSLLWVRRLKICIGAARGLDYLHTGTGINHGIIHRDVKSSNILLDENWAAKISDFGLSKIGPINQPSTFVSTMVKGTFGYLDPDYYSTGRLTRKSDVYAFGVVLFEVLCGKRAVDRSLDEEKWGLASWAQDSIKDGRLKQIVDSNIRGSISTKCLKVFAQLADRCLHTRPKKRPTMAEVVVGLESVLALQEKANKTLPTSNKTVFGRQLPTFVFPYNLFYEDTSLKSLELYLDTMQGENKIFRRFDFHTIDVATNNFSKVNKVSHNRFTSSSIYRGTLQNGQDIAISETYSNAPYKKRYYVHEAWILLKLGHENLAELLGYCIEGTKMFLVYECAPRASLDTFLFDPLCTPLQWNKRYKIILDVARVLVYLHKHAPIRVIHGDVRPANILLNESLSPKLFGFGLTTEINKTDSVHINAYRGTLYKASEYVTISHLSTKDDIFSFGVLLLETVSGQSTFDQLSKTKNLYKHVWKNWLDETSSYVIDPRINVDSSLMTKFVEIGLLCVQPNSADRPTMEEVVDMLLGNSSLDLPVSKMRARMVRMRSRCICLPVDDYDTSAVEESISDLCPR